MFFRLMSARPGLTTFRECCLKQGTDLAVPFFCGNAVCYPCFAAGNSGYLPFFLEDIEVICI